MIEEEKSKIFKQMRVPYELWRYIKDHTFNGKFKVWEIHERLIKKGIEYYEDESKGFGEESISEHKNSPTS